MMKEKLKNMIHDAIGAAWKKGELPSGDLPASIEIEEPRAEAHGDFSTNAALVSASVQKMAPAKIAAVICRHILDPEGMIAETKIAGPGFINFYLSPETWKGVLKKIHSEGSGYGASDLGKGGKVQVEFVSANPTGPLHVGHGRGAVVGDAVAAILSHCGYDVEKEYYINDSGRQIRTLGTSVLFRYRQLCGENVDFPQDCYQGDYITEYAGLIRAADGDKWLTIGNETTVSHFAEFAADRILAGIRRDLADFGVIHDKWFSEQSLYDAGLVEKSIGSFREKGLVYEKDGALWFRTTDFGDEKDRVVVRSNGETTYFASDIAYHEEKFKRGFERVIDVWGADHHGYISRLSGAVTASGMPAEAFRVILINLVNLLRDRQPVAMSTRAGEFVTLKQVVDEVGRDAARFLFLTRHYESPLDFDLELAKKKTNDNPVYYVQYVHARICSIHEKAVEKGLSGSLRDDAPLGRLSAPGEIRLMKILARYPEVVAASAVLLEPHRIPYYLMDLASAFHSFYHDHKVLVEDDPELTAGRLYLVSAVAGVIGNGLTLLGVSAPEKM